MNRFGNFSEPTDRLIRVVSFFIYLALFSNLLTIILIINPERFTGSLPTTLMFLIIGGALLLVLVLLPAFQNDPVTQGIKHLRSKVLLLESQIEGINADIQRCESERFSIDTEKQKLIDHRNQSFRSQKSFLESNYVFQKNQFNVSYSLVLRNFQESYISSGLSKFSIDDLKIQGLGQVTRLKLVENGVRTANDVSVDVLQVIPRLSSIVINSLLSWKNSLMDSLAAEFRSNPPLGIQESLMIMKRDFDEKVGVFKEKIMQLEDQLSSDLAEYELAASQQHHQNDNSLKVLKDNLTSLSNDLLPLRSELGNYSNFTFPNFVLYNLDFVVSKSVKNSKLSKVSVLSGLGVLFFSVLLSGVGKLNATLKMSTAPKVPLLVEQTVPVSSSNDMGASTSVVSSPTVYQSPTKLITSTMTPTFTITLSPTITPTETQTLSPTPTVTLPFIANADCIPKDTLREVGVVTRVVDGDTIRVRINGSEYPVRYIGMDAPESGSSDFSSQSTQKNHDLVFGKEVILISDVSNVDKYDRLLRYVVVDDVFVNDYLVRNGLASQGSYPPDIACDSTFKKAQQLAMVSLLGFWAPQPTQKSADIIVPLEPVYICNCSIDYDCGDFASHGQAQACFESCGGSSSFNWSRLDSDHDGSVCESLP